MREVPASQVVFKIGKDSEKFGIPYKDPYAGVNEGRKLTATQLRRIIKEEITRITEMGAAASGSPKRKLKLGQIYTNGKRHQISIEFLEGDYAGWEMLAGGRASGGDGTVEELNAILDKGGFTLDRTENVY
jgi:hypothetical protein